jgi:hypothetical protein
MTIIDLSFVCERLPEHSDGTTRQWSVKAQLRVMDPLSQDLSPVAIISDAACPECHNIGAADYSVGTVYVIPDDDSNRDAVSQIREAITDTGA